MGQVSSVPAVPSCRSAENKIPFAARLVAIDGSKFRAASVRVPHDRRSLEDELERLDRRMVHVMAKAAKGPLDLECRRVVADTGCAIGMAAACDADNITACVPVDRSPDNRGNGPLSDRTAVTSDADPDRLAGPSRHSLPRKQTMTTHAGSSVKRETNTARTAPPSQKHGGRTQDRHPPSEGRRASAHDCQVG